MTRVRLATLADLPAIHGLIRESYAAMIEPMGQAFADFWNQGADEHIAYGDLRAEAFVPTYLDGPDAYGFWVAEDDSGVVGCVGLKRTGPEEAELIRMSVTARARSGGIGALMVDALLACARKNGVTRVFLRTLNPSAARFYKRVGFTDAREEPVTFTEPAPITMTGHELAMHL